jgi:ADP-dependent NAD(P)H-hydrate dehydratase / NAD(P)H-hydrate epimerase
MIVVTAAQMQAMDRMVIEKFGLTGRLLMENAGRGATRCFLERIYRQTPGRVGVIAGRGNNGGDGFVIARYLAQRGIDVRVYLLSERARVHGDAAANLQLLPAWGVPVTELPDGDSLARHQDELASCKSWVDAILGTGLTAEVKGFFRQAIEFINRLRNPVLSVDIPSGLNADTGQPCGACIRATTTTTFGYPKIGHVVYPGIQYCGVLDVIDIGIPPAVAQSIDPPQTLLSAQNVRPLLPQRSPESHKGNHGHVLVVAGASGKTGAASLAAAAALRAGAGLVTLGIAASLNPILEVHLTEAMTIALPDTGDGILKAAAFDAIAAAAEGKTVLALGPGMGTAPSTRELIRRLVLEIDLPLVLDADGLNNITGDAADLAARRAPLVMTPHPGEAARLAGMSVAQVQTDRLEAARRISASFRAVVVLKGARTVVAEPGGRIWINASGNSGMASGGMGDILTGVIAGLAAQGCSLLEAARIGVFVHGVAADRLGRQTPYGYLAGEVLQAVPSAVRDILTDASPNPLQPVL